MEIKHLQNENRKITSTKGSFSILESLKDESVSPWSATSAYFMAKMGVRRRQVIATLRGDKTIVTQSGAMQWTVGNVSAKTGVKGAGDLLGKMIKGAVTKESAVKPEYAGKGYLVLEPTYKYLILQDVEEWGPAGMSVEDGMFLACEGTVKYDVIMRSNLLSALLGNQGLFSLKLSGKGLAVLESPVPREELIEIELQNDVIKIDGNMAVAWSDTLNFTVEKSGKSLLGSAVSAEGFVNVYRGTGKILLAPVLSSTGYTLGTLGSISMPASGK